jgi:Flp pilus assembly protein TadG
MNIRSRARGEEGAAAVEFALIVGVLAMLIFGMLQFGVAFFELQNLRAATREGARVGAVGGTGSDVKKRVASASGQSSLGSSLTVYKKTGSITGPCIRNGVVQSGCTQVADADSPCATVSGTTPDAVQAVIDLNNAGLPNSLKDIFTVEIPLLPPIPLRGAAVYGEFRCES